MKQENYRLIKLAQNGDRDALELLTINNKSFMTVLSNQPVVQRNIVLSDRRFAAF
jgi:hypothetical protein